MTTIVWIAVCVAFNVLLRDKHRIVLAAEVALWILIPGAAGSLLTGISSLHGATLLILVSWVIQMLSGKGAARSELTRAPVVYMCLGLFLIISSAETLIFGNGGLASFLNMIVAPVLFFHLASTFVRADTRARPFLINTFIALALTESLLGILQALLKNNLFWVSQLQVYAWYSSYYVRSQGTLDHPIILGIVCVAAIPLLASYRRLILVLPMMFILITGIIVSQTRSALIFAAIGAVAVIFRARIQSSQRIALTAVLGTIVVFLIGSSLTAPLLSRISDNGGDSTTLRSDAYSWILGHWASYFFGPGGYGSSFAVSESAGLGSSFESGPIMFYLDFGLVACLLFFGLQIAMIARRLATRGSAYGTAVAALGATLLPWICSAYGWSNASMIVAWSVLALSTPAATVGDSVAEVLGSTQSTLRAVAAHRSGSGVKYAVGASVSSHVWLVAGERPSGTSVRN